MEVVKSPLTNYENVILERKIDVSLIKERYLVEYQIDVSDIFKNLSYISIYKCLDTGYRFYYPFNVDGDSKFYESLQQFEWYYMDWKWEHETAMELIKDYDRVLEIGCGKGSFIERVTHIYKNTHCIGLELNRKSVQSGVKKGIKILDQSIQEYAKSNVSKYDMVCSFQVMEHIAKIHEVIKASLNVLKVGGKLIISVPNNDSFLGYDNDNFLNMPPHHMGLWNKESLTSIQKIFSVKLDQIHFEPLQKYHVNYCTNVLSKIKDARRANRARKYPFIGKLVNRLKIFDEAIEKKLHPNFCNFTAVAVYTKI